MAPERLQELLQYAWDTFYAAESQPIKMFKLFQRVVRKEMEDNTFRPRDRARAKDVFGRTLGEDNECLKLRVPKVPKIEDGSHSINFRHFSALSAF